MASSGMAEAAPKYPETYHLALDNRFSNGYVHASIEVDETPVFFYDSLMFPWVAAMVLQEPDVKKVAWMMTPGTLYKHVRYCVKYGNFPAVLSTGQPEDAVQGMVVFGLNEDQVALLDSYEKPTEGSIVSYQKEIREVEIVLQNEEKKIVEANVYLWAGQWNLLHLPEDKQWTVDGYLAGPQGSLQ